MLKRAVAFLIDHMCCSVIFGICVAIHLIVYPDSTFLFSFSGFYTFMFFTTYPAYLLKDLWFSRSLGKKLLGIQIISNEQPNSLKHNLKLILRNITLIIYPIEVLVLLFTKGNYRIGDIIAKTKVLTN